MRKNALFFTGVITTLLGATIYQLVEHGIPVKREYEVPTPAELSGLRILLLSDLHCNPLICGSNSIIQRLDAEHPDVILLAGDIISKYGKEQNQRVPGFLQKLTTIAPVVYGMGNHEEVLRTEYPKQFADYRKQVEEMGILFPDNEVVSLNLHEKNIEFAGLTLEHRYFYKRKRRSLPQEAWKDLTIPHPERTILLAHFPDYFMEYSVHAPLIVSGHIHGGLIRLPFIGGLISPQLYLPPYTRGCYKNGNSTMVVSAGIGSHSLPARLFNPVEYCVIKTKTRK